jgi:hypothetical protein
MQVAITLDEYEKQIQTGKSKTILGALQVGRALMGIRDGNLWVISGAKSFEKYASAAHGFSKSTIYNLIGVYREYGPQLLSEPSLQSVEPTRLYRLLPFTTPENKEELVNMAAHCPSVESFENNIRTLRGEVGTDECEHNFQPVNFLQCDKCGKRVKA